MCSLDNKILNASTISPDNFCKITDDLFPLTLTVCLGIVFLIFTMYIIHIYRYEIYLLWRKVKVRSRKVRLMTHYDAYISYDEENFEVRRWIIYIMLPYLERQGYHIFLPCRDLEIGGIQKEQILLNISKSKNFIVFVTENYVQSEEGMFEWNSIWNSFKKNDDRNIIIVNCDLMTTGCISSSLFSAFVRLGWYIDFCNYDHSILVDIKKRLGQQNTVSLKTGLKNTKQHYSHIFTHQELFLAPKIGRAHV